MLADYPYHLDQAYKCSGKHVLKTQKLSQYDDDEKGVNLSEAMMSFTNTLICKIAFGKKYDFDYGEVELGSGERKSRLHVLLNEAQALLGEFYFIYAEYLYSRNRHKCSNGVWAMTALMNNPRVMNKVQMEIRNLYEDKDFINEDDIEKLPYLKSVVKETLRLFPPSPLLLPRETLEKS